MPNDAIVAAASAIDAAERRHDLIAENVANSATAGFKRRVGAFRTFDEALAKSRGRIAPAGASDVGFDFAPGELRHTGADFDLALDGPGFFAVQAATGPRYTRNGAFGVNGSGELVTHSGSLVLGTAGPIRVNFPG